jgi:hypothetical protein
MYTAQTDNTFFNEQLRIAQEDAPSLSRKSNHAQTAHNQTAENTPKTEPGIAAPNKTSKTAKHKKPADYYPPYTPLLIRPIFPHSQRFRANTVRREAGKAPVKLSEASVEPDAFPLPVEHRSGLSSAETEVRAEQALPRNDHQHN